MQFGIVIFVFTVLNACIRPPYRELLYWTRTLSQDYTGRQSEAFEKGVPTARVVRLPNADHYIFRSNEADVMREMNAFLAGLK